MKAKNIQLVNDYKGGYSLICPLEKDSISQSKEFINTQKDVIYEIKIKQYRNKRSLNANAYFWQLCGKLAEKLRSTDTEVYRRYIQHMGIYRELEISNNAAETFITAWGMHGKGWIAEKIDKGFNEGYTLLHAHYGSSVYNTKQMARLIDMVVEDCKGQGIETLTPNELDLLKGEWN